jgi:hypothetical protein
MIDIIGAMVFGGILLLLVLQANYLVAESVGYSRGSTMVQEMLISTVPYLEGDLRNMGFGVDDTLAIIMSAQRNRIKFRTKLNPSSSNVDSVEYFLGNIGEVPFRNDSVRFIKRKINNESPQTVGLATKLSLKYYTQQAADTLAFPIPPEDCGEIKLIEITLEMQNPYAAFKKDPRMLQPGEQSEIFSSALWRQTRLASRNLLR